MRQKGVAVLLHASFPCTTFSCASGGKHRRKREVRAHSELGRRHDRLLEVMAAWIAERRRQSGLSGTITAQTWAGCADCGRRVWHQRGA